MANKQVAYELGTGEQAVKFHRANVMAKMAAVTFADLVRMAERLGISGLNPVAASESKADEHYTKV